MPPFFVPKSFSHIVDNATKADDEKIYDPIVDYELTYLQRIFVTLEYHHSCTLATIILYLIGLNITLNISVIILATVPRFKYTPATCSNPICQNDILCPNEIICAPRPYESLILIDAAGIILFSFDYFLRLITCYTVSPRLAGLTDNPDLKMSRFGVLIRYMCRYDSIVDFFAILPFYIIFAKRRSIVGFTSGFIRILRMPRLLKFMSNAKGTQAISALVTILLRCLNRSSKILVFTLYFYGIGIILFSTIVFVLEGGKFMVNTDYPNGAYLRDNFSRTGLEQSIFISIPTSIYFTVVTTTTLGYGDFTCQTVAGRAVACLLSFAGIIVLALPIAIIGSSFFDFYCIYLEKVDEQERRAVYEDTKLKLMFGAESIDKMKISLQHEVHCNKLIHTIGKLATMTISQEISLQRAIGLLQIVQNRAINMTVKSDISNDESDLDQRESAPSSNFSERTESDNNNEISYRKNYSKKKKNNLESESKIDIGKVKDGKRKKARKLESSPQDMSNKKLSKVLSFQLEKKDKKTDIKSNSQILEGIVIEREIIKENDGLHKAQLEKDLKGQIGDKISGGTPLTVRRDRSGKGQSSFTLAEARSTVTHSQSQSRLKSKSKRSFLVEKMKEKLPAGWVEPPVKPIPWLVPRQFVYVDARDDASDEEVRFILPN